MTDRITKLNEFLLASPGDSFLKHALGLEYIKLGNDTEAKKIFEEIITTQPSYVGTYYHLGKLLVRLNQTDNALKIYVAGMAEAEKAGDRHAYNELRGAFEDLQD